ncbi:4-(cytidine 5'-diphospho)-2-C-methyl-D-erythritol kinase, partial [Roseobacter sp.]|uniref:GHMP family kinase ATP-binding protein n=1 Tax=Roseobacter sp. TaxID=1907202 RepID=UPI0025E86ACC
MHTRRAVRVSAPAKINLALHVTGQRADGYHLLDSLVMLCSPADTLFLCEASESRLEVTGPMSGGVPSGPSNLVLKAAEIAGVTAHILLEKQLPAAAGIGGGSSDAAACLRGSSLLSGAPVPDPADQLALGSDVPVCQHNQLVHMQGIGGDLTLLGPPPDWPMVLVNPRVAVPTARVFSGLRQKENAPIQGAFPITGDNRTRIAWLAEQR